MEEAASFQAYSKQALKNSVAPASTLNFLTRRLLKTSATRKQNGQYLKTYAKLAKKRCPFRHFSNEQALEVSHSLVDGALSFAGGLSVPSLITSMLGVLYSKKHGDFAENKAYRKPSFMWETVRLYPAVVGVPFVKTGTTQREALMLPTALTDTAVWGKDAFKFTLRDEKVYKGNIDVAWNGFAEDKRYPNDDHSCPGKAMSEAMMLGFMQALEYSEWSASQTPKIKLSSPVAWNGFSLKPIDNDDDDDDDDDHE